MAGTLTMLGRPYGFFANREGGRYAPEGEDVGPLAAGEDRPGRRVVEIRGGGGYALDGRATGAEGLTEALRAAVAEEPATWVVLRVPGDPAFSSVRSALQT